MKEINFKFTFNIVILFVGLVAVVTREPFFYCYIRTSSRVPNKNFQFIIFKKVIKSTSSMTCNSTSKSFDT